MHSTFVICSSAVTKDDNWRPPLRVQCMMCHVILDGCILRVYTIDLNKRACIVSRYSFLGPGSWLTDNSQGTWQCTIKYIDHHRDPAIGKSSKFVIGVCMWLRVKHQSNWKIIELMSLPRHPIRRGVASNIKKLPWSHLIWFLVWRSLSVERGGIRFVHHVLKF